MLATRRLGRTGVELTQLGFGGASIGELFVPVSEHEALATIATAWDAGIRYFDTAPWYGRGLSELRTGSGLRDRARAEYALSTKVGRYLRPATPGHIPSTHAIEPAKGYWRNTRPHPGRWPGSPATD